jgi:hypothetical protein
VKNIFTHNPTEEGGVVNRHPTKMESIQPGTSCLCRAKTKYNWLQVGTKSKTEGPRPQLHEGA